MRKNRILMVEDSVTARKQLTDILTRNGYEVEEAVNGKDALERLKENSYPVVLTDLEMPVMGGRDLIIELQRLPKTPVILVLTVHEESEWIISIMKMGVFDYIIKPVKLSEMLMKIERAFRVAREKRMIRSSEHDEVIHALFTNLHRSFNQGAGIGTQISLLGIILSSAKEVDGSYLIDGDLFHAIGENQVIAEKAMKRFAELEKISENPPPLDIFSLESFSEHTEEALKLAERFLYVREHDIIYSGFQSIPEQKGVRLNGYWFTRALEEFLLNAMKFADPGTTIEVREDCFGGEYEVRVINLFTVPEGISELELQEFGNRVFEPFYRLTRFVYEGYESLDFGIGLTFVEKVIRDMGGETAILFAEEDGKVSVEASIRFPLHDRS